MADDETSEAPRPADADTDRRRAAGTGLVIQLIGTAAVVGLAWVMTRHYVRYLQQQAGKTTGRCADCEDEAKGRAAFSAAEREGRLQHTAPPAGPREHPVDAAAAAWAGSDGPNGDGPPEVTDPRLAGGLADEAAP